MGLKLIKKDIISYVCFVRINIVNNVCRRFTKGYVVNKLTAILTSGKGALNAEF